MPLAVAFVAFVAISARSGKKVNRPQATPKPAETSQFLPKAHVASRPNSYVKMKLTFSVHFSYG